MGLIASGIDAQAIDRPGGIFVRLLDQIANEDRVLHAVGGARASSATAAARWPTRSSAAAPCSRRKLPPLVPDRRRGESYSWTPRRPHPARGLMLDNGIGGFSGRPRIRHPHQRRQRTPAPWVNVLANPLFGSVVSESGQAYTWSENAHEFRLTPWDNDPVSDRSGEAFYLRDEQTGQFWSPTALPAPRAATTSRATASATACSSTARTASSAS
jgi:cyclic beta-1,2-glucan synthetase